MKILLKKFLPFITLTLIFIALMIYGVTVGDAQEMRIEGSTL